MYLWTNKPPQFILHSRAAAPSVCHCTAQFGIGATQSSNNSNNNNNNNSLSAKCHSVCWVTLITIACWHLTLISCHGKHAICLMWILAAMKSSPYLGVVSISFSVSPRAQCFVWDSRRMVAGGGGLRLTNVTCVERARVSLYAEQLCRRVLHVLFYRSQLSKLIN